MFNWLKACISSKKLNKKHLIIFLLAVHLLPIWLFNYFPSQDGPEHLHNASVLKDIKKEKYSTLREYYQLHITLAPNLVSYFFLAGLMYILPPLIAEKILVSLCVGLLPLAIFYFLDGVNATDPMRQMPHFLKQLDKLGFSGVNNFPTVGVMDGKFRQGLEETGFGFYKEVDMVKIANDLDIFSIVYVFNPSESKRMAEAGADVIIAHMGTTVGGTIGVETTMNLKEAAEKVQQIIEEAKAVNPNIITLSHGGPIATPKDAAYINQHTDAVGFVGASSIERLAVEKAIREMTRQFKKIPIK